MEIEPDSALASESDTPTRERLPRWAKALSVVGAFAILTPAVGVGLVSAHLKFTPKFHEYVRDTPFDDALLPHPPPERVLSRELGWFAGDVDPFRFAPPERNELRQSFVVQHGDEVLLDLQQTLAYTWNEDFTERVSCGLRTDKLVTAADLRAIVSVYLEGVDTFVGPGSFRTGCATFDVWLVAGEGPDEVRYVDGPPETPFDSPRGMLRGTHDSGFAGFVHVLHPAPTLPSCGLGRHLRRSVHLTAERREGGASSSSWSELEHSVTTTEYSYDVRSEFVREEGLGIGTESYSTSRVASWNGQVW